MKGSVLLFLLMPLLATCGSDTRDSTNATPTPQPTNAATPTPQPTSASTLTPPPTSGGGTPTPQPTSGPMLTPQQRTASLDAIHTKFASLTGTDVIANNKTLAQFIGSRPEFSASGTSDGGKTVWGKWTDGVLYLIVRDREISAPNVVSSNVIAPNTVGLQTGASHASTPKGPSSDISLAHERKVAKADAPEDGFPSNLPGSNKFRLLSAMGKGFEDVRTKLRNYLSQQQYKEVDADATIIGLSTVSGDGVFYFDTHAGDGSGIFALSTSNKRTEANDVYYAADLNVGRLAIMNACFDAQIGCDEKDADGKIAHPEAYEDHYGITPLFIHDHWGNFADHSLVYLDGCLTNSDNSKDLLRVLADKKANVVMGWGFNTSCHPEMPQSSCGEVHDPVARDSALYVFDRLLGANDFEPVKSKTGFNQRSFDWHSVVADCVENAHHCSEANGTELKVFEAIPGCADSGNCNQTFGLLTPSIREMWVFEKAVPGPMPGLPDDTLFIAGLFGLDPGETERQVSIDGTDVKVEVWSPYMIIVTLPHIGGGTSGDVIVRVHDHTSNAAQLTEWIVPYTFKLTDIQQLRQTVTVNAHFRADIRKNVRVIGQAPVEPRGSLEIPGGMPIPPVLGVSTMLNDSTGSYQCTGSATTTDAGKTTTETWNGSGSLSYTDESGIGQAGNSTIEVRDSATLVFTLADWKKTFARTITNPDYGTTVGSGNVFSPGAVKPAPGGANAGKFVMSLDEGVIVGSNDEGHIRSLSALAQNATVAVSLSWPDTPPLKGAPDPNGVR